MSQHTEAGPGLDWGDLYDRADGSHMTQMDVDGGRTLTIARVEQVTHERKRRALVHWVEDVLPWLMPQQEALLLKALGWSRTAAGGKRLFLERDPNVRFGAEKVGGSRIYGSPDLDGDKNAQWRCGNRTLRRQVRRTEDPDPLWGLVVVRLGLPLQAVDDWAKSQGKPVPSTMTGGRRVQVARALDTEQNRAAILAFARGGAETTTTTTKNEATKKEG